MDYRRESQIIRQTENVTVVETITNPEVVPWSYGRHGQTWRPERLTVRASRTRQQGEPWGEWSRDGVKVEGVNIRAGGQDGADREESGYPGPEFTRARVRAIMVGLGEESRGGVTPDRYVRDEDVTDLD